jgi:hypothetical protein
MDMLPTVRFSARTDAPLEVPPVSSTEIVVLTVVVGTCVVELAMELGTVSVPALGVTATVVVVAVPLFGPDCGCWGAVVAGVVSLVTGFFTLVAVAGAVATGSGVVVSGAGRTATTYPTEYLLPSKLVPTATRNPAFGGAESIESIEIACSALSAPPALPAAKMT